MCKWIVYAKNPKTKKFVKVETMFTTGDCGFNKGESISHTHPRFGKVLTKRAS